MPVAVVGSRALAGSAAPRVTVEAHLSGGLPAFHLVGLPEAEVREARDRVRAAIQNAQYDFPARRVTVNLAPADLPKESGRFDLPIALGILTANGQLPQPALDAHEFAGELALSGELRPIRGALAMVLAAKDAGRAFVLPVGSAGEAALVRDARVLPARSLLEVCAHLRGQVPLSEAAAPESIEPAPLPDLADVRGQAHAKRALAIAAAGGHSLLFVAIVGGGSHPRPGEISLAHHGVLFLDELPEWDRRVLEVLREPLETGVVNIARAARQASFPAQFQLVAAMNPCPCGHRGDPRGRCRCTPDQVARYRGRLSGPLLDRIDLVVEVPVPPPEALALGTHASGREESAEVRAHVVAARDRAWARQGTLNARLDAAGVARHCVPVPVAHALLAKAVARLGLSARAFHRVAKVARTIADLAGDERIESVHMAEAIGCRRADALRECDGTTAPIARM